ncbi:MAG: hypothetical protein GF344_06270 [Chitinivibrionales bacterium]|nr:hypothetical protein [Chitinivibrionales bacterium]MBD3356538.1 hypothetical protein [Chitinivibrionales bacterium]
MKKVKNPNDIVAKLVADYREVLGDSLVSVIMYGSAVTHEYTPGVSDINIAVVLTDSDIVHVSRSVAVQRKWRDYGVAVPIFMTQAYIVDSLDTFPIEFLDMQNNYRVLHGEDVLAGLEIGHEHLRLQCERKLRKAALHLRRSYVRCDGRERLLYDLLKTSLREIIPVFKALLVLGGEAIPRTRSDVIAAVEDMYKMGASVISEIHNSDKKTLRGRYHTVFERYVTVVDSLVRSVDSMAKG